ncbi:MAG: phosphoadenosine phosphosulfate reductase family protein [Thermoplasmata archaeon]
MSGCPRFWSLLSGGKDSVCTAHVLASRGELAGCVFLDTGIACTDTRPFVERFCSEMGWPLRIYTAPKTYEEIVSRWGFPSGPGGHRWAFGWLKERPLRIAWQDLLETEVFASGARRLESARRGRTMRKGFRHNYGIRIENPIQEWTTPEVLAYNRESGLPTSPAYRSIGMSGDCLCGAFSQPGEANAIRRTYPEVAARIRALELRIAEEGEFRYPKDRWGHIRRFTGGFVSLEGRTTLEQFVCGGECRVPEPTLGAEA